MSVELDQRPLIDMRKLDEAIALPLLGERARSAVLSTLAQSVQKQRPDFRCRHAARESSIRSLVDACPRP
jgi:hypothetical protein